MAARVFQRDEQEFLRICAMAAPDWAALRGMATGQFNWDYLRTTALAHQLGGVVPWRLLDERMDGVAPNIVRDDCQQYLDYLDGAGAIWRAKAQVALAPLVAAGIPYVDVGSRPCYALLGMDHWPREWDDIDVYIPSARWYDAQAALGPATPGVGSYFIFERENPDDLKMEILSRPPEFDRFPEGLSGWHRLFENARTYTLCGGASPVPEPELWLWVLARRTYDSISCMGAPLPLWALARLANVTALPGFSWEKLLAHMQDWHTRHIALRKVLEAMAKDEIPYHCQGDLFEASAPARMPLTVLAWTEEAYPGTVPESFFEQARAEFGSEWASIWGCRGPDTGPRERIFCLWDQPPTLEEWLFDAYGIQDAEARIAAGWWRLVDGATWEKTTELPWYAQHLREKIKAPE